MLETWQRIDILHELGMQQQGPHVDRPPFHQQAPPPTFNAAPSVSELGHAQQQGPPRTVNGAPPKSELGHTALPQYPGPRYPQQSPGPPPKHNPLPTGVAPPQQVPLYPSHNPPTSVAAPQQVPQYPSVPRASGPPPSVPAGAPPPQYPGSSAPPIQQRAHNIGTPSSTSNKLQAGRKPMRRSESRIDPSQIPRPPSIHLDPTAPPKQYDTRNNNNKLPPAATSFYVATDTGNCSPRYMRSTLHHVPTKSEILNHCKIPLGVVVQPLAHPGEGEEHIPFVNLQMSDRKGPLRCGSCRGYINCFVKFLEEGNKWACNLCGSHNIVSSDYHCHLDAYSQRRDREERAELSKGSVEFEAPEDYCLRPPQPPNYVFVIDVSRHALESGMFAGVLTAIRKTIEWLLSCKVRCKVGIITFGKELHFYNIGPSVSEPQMLLVPDTKEVFPPLPLHQWLVGIEEGEQQLNSLLDLLPRLFAIRSAEVASTFHTVDRSAVSGALGSALSVTYSAMQDIGGRVLVFHASLPSQGLGMLKDREAAHYFGTEKEKIMYTAVDNEIGDFYERLSNGFAVKKICVDLFTHVRKYGDVATLAQIPAAVGGQVYLYPSGENLNVNKLVHEVLMVVTRETVFEAVLKTRCSKGLRVKASYGHVFRGRLPSDEVELPGCDHTKTLGIVLEHTEELQDKSDVFIQCALLYTSVEGKRILRIHNLVLPSTSALVDAFRYANVEASCCLMQKIGAKEALTSQLTAMQERHIANCVEVLYNYRRFCAAASSSGQLILPESLKLLPLYTLAMIKNAAFRPNAIANTAQASRSGSRNPAIVRPDERAFLLSQVATMDVHMSIKFVYPRLYRIHDMSEECGNEMENGMMKLPDLLWPSAETLCQDGIFLLDCGVQMFLLLCDDVSPVLLQHLFGISSLRSVKTQDLQLLPLDNAFSQRLTMIVEYLRFNNPVYQHIRVVKRSEPAAEPFMQYLVEDKVKSQMSYVEFLCLVHKRIQQKFASHQ